MASRDGNQGETPQNSNVNTMDALMQYFQETLRSTQEEFRRMFSAIKYTIGLPRNDRPTSVPPGNVGQAASSQHN